MEDYDFKKKQIPLKIEMGETVGAVFGIGGIDYNFLETDRIAYPMKEEEAKAFKEKENHKVKDSYYAYYCKPRSDNFKIYQGKLLAIDFVN